ncbi:MAG TPA: hypothetical protein VF247_09010 [Candidatus Krumholzibacteria bacterium]
MGRFATGLVVASLLLPATARATTAPSLSDRIKIDGVLDEYAPDEWVLDDSSVVRERAGDSAWGSDDDIVRVAITWDHDFLYLAVEGRTFDSFLSMFIANRAGGLRTLEDAGTFRRAIELTGFAVNIMALASPQRVPDVARADDAHPFALVDGGALHRAVSGVRGGAVGFEMAVPWSMLSLASPVRVIAAITGEVGTGAGDAAPDASVHLDNDPSVRAVLDRRVVLVADVNRDGVPDDSMSTRDAAEIEGGTAEASSSADASMEISVPGGAFAPDRGETRTFSMRIDTTAPVFVSAAVYSLEGRRVRTLFADDMRSPAAGEIPAAPEDAWDGHDESGHIVRGGAYIVVVDWGFARGEKRGRAKAPVVVGR